MKHGSSRHDQPGAVGKWHTYPNHHVVYVAEGTVTVEFRDSAPKVYKAGEGFVEPINTVLQGRNKGRTPVKLVIFQLSHLTFRTPLTPRRSRGR